MQLLRKYELKNVMFAFVFALLVTLLIASITPAFSQQPAIDVSTPAVAAIQKSIAGRFAVLKPQFDLGVIGLTSDGFIAVRDFSPYTTSEKLKLETIIGEENKDRATLYREIARANGRPDWESDLKTIFGERWINRAPAGWYYRDSAGKWIRKV
jgi:uncharacterized protein